LKLNPYLDTSKVIVYREGTAIDSTLFKQ